MSRHLLTPPMRRLCAATLSATCLAFSLAGCGEKPQELHAKPKVDDKPWQSGATPHAADGWKGGSQADWQQQIRSRTQAQNEYTRTGQPVGAAQP